MLPLRKEVLPPVERMTEDDFNEIRMSLAAEAAQDARRTHVKGFLVFAALGCGLMHYLLGLWGV